MKSIKDILSHNIKRLRGDRTQTEMAEIAGIPMRTYQNAEAGSIPHFSTLAALAKAFRVPETELFLDQSLLRPREPSPQEIVAIVHDALEARKKTRAQTFIPPDLELAFARADERTRLLALDMMRLVLAPEGVQRALREIENFAASTLPKAAQAAKVKRIASKK